jgi:uncharacterized protein (DUF2236 family)
MAASELPGISGIRRRLAGEIFAKVAGTEGPQRRERIHTMDGPRLFSEDRPIRRVHADASMFVGGLRAVLLQSLHPLAMAAVAGHSGFRGDPWGRLQRTSYFLAVTTFSTVQDAEQILAQVRAIHSGINGTTADGRAYAASDPHLLKWVHVAEVDSFLLAHRRYGSQPLDRAGRDGYVADCARIARMLGIPDPPESEAELAEALAGYRRELSGGPQARDAARFLLLRPPVPLAVRAPYAALAAAAVGMLPRWARLPLWLPYLPVAEATVVRLSGTAVTRTIRWAMQPAA